MTRPTYETEENRDAQNFVMKCIENHLRVKCIPTEPLAAFDFLIVNSKGSKIIGCAEFKRRYNEMNKYETFFISEQKLIHGLQMAELSKAPFMLVVQWNDTIALKQIKDISGYRVEIGGRYDRGDSKDEERMIHIPVKEFHKLK